jgi:two-component system, NtrC family, nitrogen regulation response regulator NtrX
MKHDILIVDDEVDIRALIAGLLQDEGFETREAGHSDEALAEVEKRRPGLVLLDIWLQGSTLDGLGILKEIKRDYPSVPVLMMSGHGTVETAVQAIQDGAYDFIEKPFKSDRLLFLVERALEIDRLRRENQELRLRTGRSDELVGESAAIRDLGAAISKVAPANSRVFISGSAGSGKEIVARQIHKLSRRAEAPFIVVNCATMVPEHAEETLFGLELAGQTSDAEIRPGMFEMAHNGTLFLDEVSDMPIETQGKIIRVLQDQVFQRVGGASEMNVDVRVIAATTRNIAEEVAAGRFREDLYYRLNVVPLEIPELKDHPEDIGPLARYFMERAAESAGQSPRVISDDAISALQAYAWPGNVRELKNIIERLLIMAPGDISESIGLSMLPPEIGADGPVPRADTGNQEVMGLPLRDAREIFEREYLAAQVTRFGGNISKTADFVGMERSALHRKLKSLGIQ